MLRLSSTTYRSPNSRETHWVKKDYDKISFGVIAEPSPWVQKIILGLDPDTKNDIVQYSHLENIFPAIKPFKEILYEKIQKFDYLKLAVRKRVKYLLSQNAPGRILSRRFIQKSNKKYQRRNNTGKHQRHLSPQPLNHDIFTPQPSFQNYNPKYARLSKKFCLSSKTKITARINETQRNLHPQLKNTKELEIPKRLQNSKFYKMLKTFHEQNFLK
ncbi:unnamed protein product [Moneuplotes crassus]|uniref:Uncharacterized protein n=1 Tax=Euplotes crassus TaxID=5936 RepID=A0AAD1XG18_EUPCR|nr:unnamed protein product [Moneuplotes crassus]